ncbi:MAG TPA: transketolase C-terminal domain-containing protein [Anaerolineae bacterium]|nr:transketolase C-terminal domain-containing protein [Anaerolineae bacterium]
MAEDTQRRLFTVALIGGRRDRRHHSARSGCHRRCLLPLDEETLARSGEKTHWVLIVEEDNLAGGWGAEVAALLGKRCFYHLDAPIARVAAPDSPVPTAPALEKVYLPDVERITAAVRALLEGG